MKYFGNGMPETEFRQFPAIGIKFR